MMAVFLIGVGLSLTAMIHCGWHGWNLEVDGKRDDAAQYWGGAIGWGCVAMLSAFGVALQLDWIL